MSKSNEKVKCPKCGSEDVWELYTGVCIVGFNPNTKEEETTYFDVNDWNDCFSIQCNECEEEWEK